MDINWAPILDIIGPKTKHIIMMDHIPSEYTQYWDPNVFLLVLTLNICLDMFLHGTNDCE